MEKVIMSLNATELQIGSTIFAFLAAVLWLYSATIKVPKNFDISVIPSMATREGYPAEDPNFATGFSHDLVELGKGLARQSRVSARAAMCAAISAGLQSISFYV